MSNDAHKRITEVDYDNVVENLIQFYDSQDYWKDYNFRGSNLNFIIRSMAYAMHYAAFYANMQSSENTLGTSQIRNSAVANSRALSYTPRSITASKAVIDILTGTPNPASPRTITLRKGAQFKTQVVDDSGDTNEKVFITTRSYTSTVLEGTDHAFIDVELYEGKYRTVEYVVDLNDKDQVFLLPNTLADTTLLEVYVQEGTDNNVTTRYSKVDETVNVNGESKVYFLEEYMDGIYRVFFGDGILGKPVANGKIVRVVYFETSGESANGATSFSLANDSRNSDLMTISPQIILKTASNGGAPAETIDSIKFFAPRKYVNARRAFTTQDWKSVVLSEFPDIRNVKVWGGEDEVTPYDHYGKVFISLNRSGGGPIVRTMKDQILNVLKTKYRISEIEPVIVEPEYIWINATVQVSLDSSSRDIDTAQISIDVKNAIIAFSKENLEDFDDRLELSKLSTACDSVDSRISGTTFTMKIETRQPIDVNNFTSYETNFRNAIKAGTVESSKFVMNSETVLFRDAGNGSLNIVRAANSDIVTENAATVVYSTGDISVSPIVIQRSASETFDLRFSAEPLESFIDSKRNKIIAIDPSQIQVRFR